MAILLSSFIAASHHILQHELWLNGRYLREIFPYYVRFDLFSDLVCAISVF